MTTNMNTSEKLAAIVTEDAKMLESLAPRVAHLGHQLAEAAIRALGSEQSAARWLVSDAIMSLRGLRPIDLVSTPEGVERVRQVLAAIEEGVI